MLQGYFDDSGSESVSPLFVVAGYVLASEKWADFADEWKAALLKRPKIDYLKMREAFAGEGQFASYDFRLPEFRMAKVRELLAVLQKRSPKGIATALGRELRIPGQGERDSGIKANAVPG